MRGFLSTGCVRCCSSPLMGCRRGGEIVDQFGHRLIELCAVLVRVAVLTSVASPTGTAAGSRLPVEGFSGLKAA